jgi:phage major head subunit gpT-like protein
MVINRANMEALFQTFDTKFTDAQKKAAERVSPNDLMLEDIALVMNSSGAATVHSWIEQIHGMREWIGERLIRNLKLGKLTVTNADFENTISVPRNDVEDDQYGTFAPLFAMLGMDAESIWLKRTVQVMLANGDWADGNPFFCAGRLIGESTITNAVTTALGKAAVETGIAAMRSFTLYGGEPAEVRPVNLVVGPSLESEAKSICEAEIIANTAGTAGISNVSAARVLKVRVSDRLIGTHAAKWFITGEKGYIPGLAVQKRKLPVLVRKDRVDDDNVFFNKEFVYGTDCRGEAFGTLPFLLYAGGMADVPEWSQEDADAALV